MIYASINAHLFVTRGQETGDKRQGRMEDRKFWWTGDRGRGRERGDR